jgi:hypothetical protein
MNVPDILGMFEQLKGMTVSFSCPMLTVAEKLLTLAQQWKAMPSNILIISPNDMRGVERTALALKFAKLPPVTLFRAIVEDWDFDRCVREVHS